MDREPAGLEASLFTSTRASRWNEDMYFVDVPRAQKVVTKLMRAWELWHPLSPP
jgi:hypothetical protein